MKFSYTIIYVDDVEKTVAFYEAAFGLTRSFITENANYAQMATGDTSLAFAQTDFVRDELGIPFAPRAPNAAALGVEIGLISDDVAASYARALDAGAAAVKPPQTKPWGQVVAYVHDVNGFLVEICTPMAG